jgi:hypothetical protein
MTEKYTPEGIFGGFISVCGGLTMIGAIGIVVYQCGLWLRDGRWTAISIEDTLGRAPPLAWVGVSKIVEWIWSCPLSVGVFGVGLIVMWIGGNIAESAPSRRR